MNNRMKDRVKEAFDTIHAESELKDKTREFLARRTRRNRTGNRFMYRCVLSAAACCFLLMAGFGGGWVYFTPAAVISIDINPSIELGVNRFDRVVSVEGYNDDGDRLAEKLDVRFMDYTKAVERILADESVADYLAQDEFLSIVVVEPDGKRNGRMLENLSYCVSKHENVHCHSADTQAVEAAHAEGLSYGKYWAFLKLRELDPDITAEDVRGMTMREIADLFYLMQPEGTGDVWHDAEEDWHDAEEDWHDAEETPPTVLPDDGKCDIPYKEGHHGKEHGHGHGKE